MKAGQVQGVNKFTTELNESKYKSFKKYPLTKIDNPWDNLSIETIIYPKRLIINSLSMGWEVKKISMESRRLFTLELTCLKIKKPD
jgi:hypothetical protein